MPMYNDQENGEAMVIVHWLCWLFDSNSKLTQFVREMVISINELSEIIKPDWFDPYIPVGPKATPGVHNINPYIYLYNLEFWIQNQKI